MEADGLAREGQVARKQKYSEGLVRQFQNTVLYSKLFQAV